MSLVFFFSAFMFITYMSFIIIKLGDIHEEQKRQTTYLANLAHRMENSNV